jgi:hypothetical protein
LSSIFGIQSCHKESFGSLDLSVLVARVDQQEVARQQSSSSVIDGRINMTRGTIHERKITSTMRTNQDRDRPARQLTASV